MTRSGPKPVAESDGPSAQFRWMPRPGQARWLEGKLGSGSLGTICFFCPPLRHGISLPGIHLRRSTRASPAALVPCPAPAPMRSSSSQGPASAVGQPPCGAGCLCGARRPCGAGCLCGAGFLAGLGPLYPPLPPTHSLAQWSKPPGLPGRRSRRQSDTIPNRAEVPIAIRPARLRAPPQAAAARWSKPPGLPCRRSRRQSNTLPSSTDSPKTFRRQDWRRGPHDCALHRKPPLQGGASRQACHAGGRAGRATQSRAAQTPQKPSAAKTGGVARTTARSTSSRRCKVEQAARLAMPAVAPAEQHNPERYGSPNRHPARTAARSTRTSCEIQKLQRPA